MNDQLKFHRMTKPVRFRTLKVVYKSLGQSYSVGVGNIKYLFNYLLYKCFILKRYTHSVDDTLYNVKPNGNEISPINYPVKTKFFSGTIQTILSDHYVSREDYFYYLDRKGNKHITYTVEDHVSHTYSAVTSFIDPGLVFEGVEYKFNKGIKIVQQYRKPEIISPYIPDRVSDITSVRPDVVQYDLTKLCNIRTTNLVGDVRTSTLSRYVEAEEKGRNDIIAYLNRLTLKDLEV